MTQRASFRSASVLVLLAMSGCIRTDITSERDVPLAAAPYKKYLVCSVSRDPARAAQMESVLAKMLSQDSVVVQTCGSFLKSAGDGSSDRVLEAIQQEGFDGVLVTQRMAIAVSSPTVENVLLGPKVSSGTDESVDPTEASLLVTFASLREFVNEYAARRALPRAASAQDSKDTWAGPFGEDRIVRARADLIGVRENRTVWSTGGIVFGSADKPIEKFMKSFAGKIESGLIQARYIRK